MIEVKEKLQKVVDVECDYADRDGSSKLSTCDHPSWDRDVWLHRHEIMNAIVSRGYDVNTSVRFGVLDIYTTKKLGLK